MRIWYLIIISGADAHVVVHSLERQWDKSVLGLQESS